MPEPTKKRPTRAKRERDAKAAAALLPVPKTTDDVRDGVMSMFERLEKGEIDEVFM